VLNNRPSAITRKLVMKKSADRPRPLDVRAALAIAAAAAAPLVALNEIIPAPAAVVTAEPSDSAVPDPSGGSGGNSPYSPQYSYVDDFDYASLGDAAGGGG
jgi:hypothetical protein